MLEKTGDLCICVWFRFVDNLALDVLLGTSFIDCFIWGLFSSESMVVSWHSPPMMILWSLQTVSALFADTAILNGEWTTAAKSNDVDYEEEEEEFHLCWLSRQIKITSLTQAEISFKCQEEGLLLVETSLNTIKRRISINSRGVMDIHA